MHNNVDVDPSIGNPIMAASSGGPSIPAPASGFDY